MLTKGHEMDYVINFIITKRVCESFDNNFEQYVRTHYVKLLKRSQKIDKMEAEKFNLAQSLAFYLHQDNELMDSNFDEENDDQQKPGLLRTLAIKLGIKKPKELKSQLEEINHLKF